MTTLVKWAIKAFGRAPPYCLLRFPVSDCKTIRSPEVSGEGRREQLKRGRYYFANVDDVISSRCHIIGKLDFGTMSTVWLVVILSRFYLLLLDTDPGASCRSQRIARVTTSGYAPARKTQPGILY